MESLGWYYRKNMDQITSMRTYIFLVLLCGCALHSIALVLILVLHLLYYFAAQLSQIYLIFR